MVLVQDSDLSIVRLRWFTHVQFGLFHLVAFLSLDALNWRRTTDRRVSSHFGCLWNGHLANSVDHAHIRPLFLHNLLFDFAFQSHLVFYYFISSHLLRIKLQTIDVVFQYIVLINLTLILDRRRQASLKDTTFVAADHWAYHRLDVFLTASRCTKRWLGIQLGFSLLRVQSFECSTKLVSHLKLRGRFLICWSSHLRRVVAVVFGNHSWNMGRYLCGDLGRLTDKRLPFDVGVVAELAFVHNHLILTSLMSLFRLQNSFWMGCLSHSVRLNRRIDGFTFLRLNHSLRIHGDRCLVNLHKLVAGRGRRDDTAALNLMQI